MTQKHTITALVQNEAGTLNRLVSLFRRRGFSLGSLNAGDCEQPGFSRVTLVVNGDDNVLRQCMKQLEKLIDVVEVDDLQPHASVSRELALIKVEAKPGKRSEVLELLGLFNAKVAHVSEQHVTIEMTELPRRVNPLIRLLKPYGLTEVVRTGLVAIRTEPEL